MEVDLQGWLIVVVNAAASVMFLHFGRRHRDRILMSAGIGFIAATLLVTSGQFFDSSSAFACGYATGFVASVLGWLGALQAYVKRRGATPEDAASSTLRRPP